MLTKQVTINLKTGERKVKMVAAIRNPPQRDPWEVLAERMLDNWQKEKAADAATPTA